MRIVDRQLTTRKRKYRPEGVGEQEERKKKAFSPSIKRELSQSHEILQRFSSLWTKHALVVGSG